MKKQISPKIVSLIFAILVICFAIAFYAFSWTGPTADPPGDNVDPPINTGGTGQYKLGALAIGGPFLAYSDAIIDGNVGIGTPPSQKLDVDGNIVASGTICDSGGTNCIGAGGGGDNLGNHIATQILDMTNHRIVNVAAPINNNDAANKAYVDAQVGGAEFGGMFSYLLDVWLNPFSCMVPNPITGSCTCPPGFTAVALADYKMAGLSGWEGRDYFCYR